MPDLGEGADPRLGFEKEKIQMVYLLIILHGIAVGRAPVGANWAVAPRPAAGFRSSLMIAVRITEDLSHYGFHPAGIPRARKPA